jgi:hypothetical protein
MNPFKSYPILTCSIIDQPPDIVVEQWWYDSVERKPDLANRPQYLVDFLKSLEATTPRPSTYLHERKVAFDLGWTYRGRPSGYDPRDDPMPALFWMPRNAPGKTTVMVDSRDGGHTFMGPSVAVRNWQFFWMYIDDADAQASVCRFEFMSDYEKVHREVWAGLDTDDERKPKWRFDRGGPVQPFERPNNYRAPRIQDRLTRSSIADYCSRFDCDIRSDDFWDSDAPAHVVWQNLKGTYPDPPYRPS